MPRGPGAVAGLYDRWASHPRAYEAMTRLALFGRRERLRRQAIASLGLEPGDRVLDLACGAGADLEPLAEAVGPEGTIVAIDVSPGMLARAARRAERIATRVELREADLAAAEIEPGAYDGALVALSLSALPDRAGALAGARAALRPGAALAVLDTLPFRGPARVLNPLIGPAFRGITNWNYDADLPAELRAAFDRVEIERFNAGSALVATARAH